MNIYIYIIGERSCATICHDVLTILVHPVYDKAIESIINYSKNIL